MKNRHDDDEILKDGETRRVPLTMRDSTDAWRGDMHARNSPTPGARSSCATASSWPMAGPPRRIARVG
jgi:hypothetical protein